MTSGFYRQRQCVNIFLGIGSRGDNAVVITHIQSCGVFRSGFTHRAKVPVSFFGLRTGLFSRGEFVLQFSDASIDAAAFFVDGRCGDLEGGSVIVSISILSLIKDRIQPVVFRLRNRIVLVRMALRAAGSETHPDLQRRVDSILHSDGAELFVIRATLVVAHRVAMKGRCDELIGCGVLNQITSKLFDSHLIQGHVGIDRID